MIYTISKIKQNIIHKINTAAGQKIADVSDLVLPPNPEMGDFSFACFNLAKNLKSNPVEAAKNLAEKIKSCQTVKEIKAVGPYLNFTIQPKKIAEVLNEVKKNYGHAKLGKGKKIIVEFASPNVNKPFHIGHLRNIITGEAMARLLENVGYKIVRVNYTSDIGMNVAKSIWGVMKYPKEFEKMKQASPSERAKFLGMAYAHASQKFVDDAQAQTEIKTINKGIYNKDAAIMKWYALTKRWSLQYFNYLYKRLHARFDRDYFESIMAEPGILLVQKGVRQGIFQKSDGAIIFKGSEHGLHDRVFINSEGLPTYEAKEMALAQKQLNDYHPQKILHIVGKEQTEYFKVVIKALEQVLPKSKNREVHLPYGWVSLKNGKMSSRLGNVVLGEFLIEEIKVEILKIISQSGEIKKTEQEKLAEKISIAAVKYAFLKNGIDKDIAFDINESVSLSGNSGPYLLYTCARIKSILNKSKVRKVIKSKVIKFGVCNNNEHKLLLKLALFPEITKAAAEKLDPSIIAKYLFELAQSFNDYYHRVPILKAEAGEREFKLALIGALALILKQGAELLGFETVERM